MTTETFKQFSDALVEPSILVEPGGAIVAANAAAENFIESAGLGRRLDAFPGDDTAALVQLAQGALAGRKAAGATVTLNGNTLWCQAAALESGDARHVMLRFLPQPPDARADRLSLISERAARLEAEQASRAKDDFLATLSCELRWPLNSVVAWTQLLRLGKLEADARRDALDAIDKSCRAQCRLVDELLDMSGMIAGKLRMEPARTDPQAVLTGVVDSLRETAAARKIEISTQFDDRACEITCDPLRLQQIAAHLLTNAVKFTPPGGRVSVVSRRVGGHWELRVMDSGPGIPPAFRPHLFERFRQADTSAAREHGGLGLGLSITRHLVHLHGGDVKAESPGELGGATFIVSLPADVGFPGGHMDAGPSWPRSPAMLSLARVRVLCLDDHSESRTVTRRLLENFQAEVLTTASAGEALDAAESWKPHVILSDIGMPGTDGYEFIRQLRRRPPTAGGSTPAVAVTGYAKREDRDRAAAAGFQMHLAKPVEPAELIAAIADLAGSRVT